MTYTAITFAPVQSFIRASRKLRDLYGSSLLLSHLARAMADDVTARGLTVISPASVSSSRGVPNVLVIAGDYRKGLAREALMGCWRQVLDGCRTWLESQFPLEEQYDWISSWKACAAHTWELFHGQGITIAMARQALAVNKQQRDWEVPNWIGESSTLSSAEAVVRPRMGAVVDPRDQPAGLIQQEARAFLKMLRDHKHLGEAFAGENEEISLTELVKRLVTYQAVAGKALKTLKDPNPDVRELIPSRFQDLSLIAKENEAARTKTSESIAWFMADGDGIGEHLMNLKKLSLKDADPDSIDADENAAAEAKALSSFSAAMRNWAAGLYTSIPDAFPKQATVVYAGGDDLFGALHESEPGNQDLHTTQLWQWLKAFPGIWEGCGQEGLTVSMGVVWADAQVPQREALQHARNAEASAKARGKNRFALRLLYASGNHLEWTCPWDWLAPILQHYTDREGRSLHPANSRRKADRDPSWRHLAEDLKWLQSRQAIASTRSQHEAMERTARALWHAYFPGCDLTPEPPRAITAKPGHATSVHPEAFRASFEQPEQGRRFDQWLLDLGRVMAGLEKHDPPNGARVRARQEVAA